MPKQTDITGTVRIPEEHMGRFWNFMRSMPTCEFTPIIVAEVPAKRSHGKTTEGSTGKCIVLRRLAGVKGRGTLTLAVITSILLEAGKAKASVANIVFELRKAKYISGRAGAGYVITAAGRKFLDKSCNAVEE